MKNITHNNINDWDWNIGNKLTDISDWEKIGIEEIQVSPDGENVAAIIKKGENYRVYDTNNIWNDFKFNKIWNLNFIENGYSYACVMTNDGWTVALQGNTWEKTYDFVWNLLSAYSNNGYSIAIAAQKNSQYFMVLNEKKWSECFPAITYCTLSPKGSKTVATVQTESHNSGEVHKFEKRIYTVAINGVPWKTKFLNVWGISISKDETSVAAEVRLNSTEYSLVVDDIIWPETYTCVWKPIFHPKKQLVAAPVRIKNKWGMAVNGSTIWNANFHQVWHQKYDSCGNNLAAIVSTKYGYWTIALNGVPWKTSVDSMLTDLTFSQDGTRIAALAKNKGYWYIVVDDFIWNNKFDMVWPPTFSQNGQNIASKVEINNKYTFVINGRLYDDYFDQAWNPKFNPEGNKLLLRVLKQGNYERRVIRIN